MRGRVFFLLAVGLVSVAGVLFRAGAPQAVTAQEAPPYSPPTPGTPFAGRSPADPPADNLSLAQLLERLKEWRQKKEEAEKQEKATAAAIRKKIAEERKSLDTFEQEVEKLAPKGGDKGKASGATRLRPVPAETGSSKPLSKTGARQPPPGNQSFRGRLYRAGRALEDGRTYRLDLIERGMITYVVPARGIDLEPHVGEAIVVWGTGVYNQDLRANVVRVHQVFAGE